MIKFVLQFVIFLAAAALPLKELFPHPKKTLSASVYIAVLFTLFLLATYAMIIEDREIANRMHESKAQNKILLDLLTENKFENKNHGNLLVDTREELKAVRGTLSLIESKDKKNSSLSLADTTLKELSEANQKLKRSEEKLRNISPRVTKQVFIKDGQFEPNVIEVETGQFLSFTNNDKVSHYIINKDGGIDFHDELLPGESYTIYVYSSKMTFNVISRDHPDIILKVNVVD